MLKERYIYPAIFNYDDNEIIIIFPDLGVATSSTNEDDAFLSARELLGLTMLGLEEDKETIPAPSKLQDIKLEEKVTLIDVYMPSLRKANINKSVNRTVTLPAWLNAKALEYNINFSQLFQDAIKKELNLK